MFFADKQKYLREAYLEMNSHKCEYVGHSAEYSDRFSKYKLYPKLHVYRIKTDVYISKQEQIRP